MKTGILAMHAEYSFGNALQTYILQQFLEQRGCSCEVIDYRPAAITAKNAEKRGNKQKIQKNYERFLQQKLKLTKAYMNKSELEELSGKYELLLTAGPGVLDGTVTRGLKPAYFSFFDKQAKKAACAISVWNNTAPGFEKEFCRKYLDSFSCITACDEEIAARLQAYSDLPVGVQKSLLLLFGPEEYKQLAEEQKPGFFESLFCPDLKKKAKKVPYIFLYAQNLERSISAIAVKLQRATELKIIHNYPGSKIKNSLGCIAEYGPEQIPAFVMESEYVVTNSPDVAMLALMFEKKLILIPAGTSQERMESLIRDYGLEGQTVRRKELFEKPEQAEADYSRIREKLAEDKKGSIKLLEELLK